MRLITVAPLLALAIGAALYWQYGSGTTGTPAPSASDTPTSGTDTPMDYLAENAKKDGVTVTASGLQYKVLEEGTGRQPAASDTVEVHYTGTLTDGTKFDSSRDRGQTIEFPLNGVIAGWTEGVQLMKEGARYEFTIPPELGYGARGAGGVIPGNATLIFDVELVAIK
jgi:FKBP-type peptidyl-prolyl cis-trans isomerase FklB